MAIAQIIVPEVVTAKVVNVVVEVTFTNGTTETFSTSAFEEHLDTSVKAEVLRRYARYKSYKIVSVNDRPLPVDKTNLNVVNLHIKKLKAYASVLAPVKAGDEAGIKLSLQDIQRECALILAELNK